MSVHDRFKKREDACTVARGLKSLYMRYKEQLLYLVFGVLAMAVSVGSFALAERVLGLPTLAANVVSWILAVAFAYWTNRTWVFESKAEGARSILKEAASFAAGRLLTLGVEELMLFVGVTLLVIDSMLVKLCAQVVVVILNYLISKFVVFRRK